MDLVGLEPTTFPAGPGRAQGSVLWLSMSSCKERWDFQLFSCRSRLRAADSGCEAFLIQQLPRSPTPSGRRLTALMLRQSDRQVLRAPDVELTGGVALQDVNGGQGEKSWWTWSGSNRRPLPCHAVHGAAGHWFSRTYKPEYWAETVCSALFPANFRPKNSDERRRAASAGVQAVSFLHFINHHQRNSFPI